MALDLRAPWQWVLQLCGGMGLLFAGSLAAAALASKGQGRRGAQALTLSFVAYSVVMLCIAAHDSAFGTVDDLALALPRWLEFAVSVTMAYAYNTERYVFDITLVLGPAFGISLLIQQGIYMPSPFLPWLTSNLPYLWVTVPTAVSGVVMMIRFAASRWICDHLLADDRRVYSAEWSAAVASDAANSGALPRLAAMSRAIAASLLPEVVRQRHRLRIVTQPDSSTWTSEVWRSSYLRRGRSVVAGPVRPRVSFSRHKKIHGVGNRTVQQPGIYVTIDKSV